MVIHRSRANEQCRRPDLTWIPPRTQRLINVSSRYQCCKRTDQPPKYTSNTTVIPVSRVKRCTPPVKILTFAQFVWKSVVPNIVKRAALTSKIISNWSGNIMSANGSVGTRVGVRTEDQKHLFALPPPNQDDDRYPKQRKLDASVDRSDTRQPPDGFLRLVESGRWNNWRCSMSGAVRVGL